MKPTPFQNLPILLLGSILLLFFASSCNEAIKKSELSFHSSSSVYFDSLHMSKQVFLIDSFLLHEEFQQVYDSMEFVMEALDSINPIEFVYLKQIFGLFLEWGAAPKRAKDLLKSKTVGKTEKQDTLQVLRGVQNLKQAYHSIENGKSIILPLIDSAFYYLTASNSATSPYMSFLYRCGADICERLSEKRRTLAWFQAQAGSLQDSIAPIWLRMNVNTIVMSQERNVGSPTRAIDIGHHNIELFNTHGKLDSALVIDCWEELAISYAFLKEKSKSQQFAEKVQSYLSAQPEQRDRLIQHLIDYASALNRIETIEASSLSLKMIQNAMELGPDMSSILYLNALKELGYTYKELGEFEKSKNAFSQALELPNDDKPLKADLMSGLAELFIYHYDKEVGITLNQKATQLLAGQSFSDPDDFFEPIEVLQDVSLPYLLEDFGMYHIMKYNEDPVSFKTSFDTVLLTFDLMNQVFNLEVNDLFEEDRIVDLKFQHQVYSKPIRFLAKQFSLSRKDQYLEKAFEFMEKSRANILLGNTLFASMATKYGVPNSVVEKGRDLYSFDRELANKRTIQKGNFTTSLNQEIENFKKLKDQYLDLLQSTYPEFHRFYFSPPRISMNDLQSNMYEKNAAVIEFQMRDSIITIACISGNQKEIRNQKFDAADMEILTSFIELISMSPDLQERHRLQEQLKQYGFHLYQKLLQPFENIWKERQMLYIIPDGLLNSIPFEALLSDTSRRSDEFFDLNFVQHVQNIGYAQSATSLVQSFDFVRNSKQERIAVFAHSNEKTIDQYADLSNLSELKGSIDELEVIQNIYRRNGNYISGNQVEKQAVLESFDDFDILHFALHAKSHPADLNSGEILFRNEQNLTAAEIYGQQMVANLVVLTACQSGMGMQINGEGVFHLARPFLMAGAKSVITNKWVLQDYVPAGLMRDFYSDYRKGLNADISLSRAKNSFLLENRQLLFPFYWAGMNITH